MASTAASNAVVKLHSASIYTAHRLAGVPASDNPTSHPLAAAARDSPVRRLGAHSGNRKEPLSLAAAMLAAGSLTAPGAPAWSLTLGTLIMVAFAGFLRYSDSSLLLVRDVAFFDSHMELFLFKRKNDQFRQGNVIVVCRGSTACCPVALTQRLISEASLLPDQPLFQGFCGQGVRAGRPSPLYGSPITYDQAHS